MPRSLLDAFADALAETLPDDVADSLGLPRGTSCESALARATLARALRGDWDACRFLFALCGERVDDAEEPDALSQALYELAQEFEAEHANSSESV